jgi:hypothetical protein
VEGMKIDLRFDNLSDDTRFQHLMRRIKFFLSICPHITSRAVTPAKE